MTPNEYLKYAISELVNLKKDEIFLVKQLFKGYEWNRIDKSVRLRIGTLFLNQIESNPELKIIKLDKTSSNQQKYKKQ